MHLTASVVSWQVKLLIKFSLIRTPVAHYYQLDIHSLSVK